MDTGILLESGTNELEILEFMVDGNHYGINVAKIREILPYSKVVLIPNAHPCIEGIFMPRDEIITTIDLAKVLNLKPSANASTDMFVVTHFNNINVAFHVHSIVAIKRVSWSEILKPDATLSSSGNGVATGVIKLEDRLVLLLDFEKIIAEISPSTTIKLKDVDHRVHRETDMRPILIAEDSTLLLRVLQDCLIDAGYKNLIVTSDGSEAWQKISEMAQNGTLQDQVKLVITDLEMPKMDGHHLLKLIRKEPKTSFLPVIIFSSIISEQMKIKGDDLGADAQVSKPEINELINEIDRLILK